MKHILLTAADISPDDEWGQRNIVDGGLAVCKVCGGSEGSLTTECLGVKVTYEQDRAVYRGLMDFAEGRWLYNQKSKSSPAYWKELRH